MAERRRKSAKNQWSAWIEGVTNRSPAILDVKPDRFRLLTIFIRGIRAKYGLRDDARARAMAKSLGLRLALCSLKSKTLVYYHLEDLENPA
jgi:hypothetical protein